MSSVPRRTVLGAAAAVSALAGLPTPASAAPTTPSAYKPLALPGGGDLGPNVIVFDPSTAGIQAKLDQIFAQQETAQFGTGRYALFFKPAPTPGSTPSSASTPRSRASVCPPTTRRSTAMSRSTRLVQRQRHAELLAFGGDLALVPSVVPTGGPWLRRPPSVVCTCAAASTSRPNGYGWASGGYIADSRIDGQVQPYSQQQWYTRDSVIGSWLNGVWNMVFSGVQGAPAQGFPNPVYTTLATTPISREKPFLYLNGTEYRVFLPRSGPTRAGDLGQRHTARHLAVAVAVLCREAGCHGGHPQPGADAGTSPLLTPGSTTSTSRSR